jgi:hypothetical protein
MRAPWAATRWLFASVCATREERRTAMVGDDIVPNTAAGWYLPRRLERFLPPSRRALRRVDERWQTLAVGDRIPDYGGRNETFTVAAIRPGDYLVYKSQRGGALVSWAIGLTAVEQSMATCVRLRATCGIARRVNA